LSNLHCTFLYDKKRIYKKLLFFYNRRKLYISIKRAQLLLEKDKISRFQSKRFFILYSYNNITYGNINVIYEIIIFIKYI